MTDHSPAPVHNSSSLDEWATELAAALDLAGVMSVDVDAILGLAGDAAHAIVRPAAPLTTFIVGFAAGRGSLDGSIDAAGATEIARALARAHADATQAAETTRAAEIAQAGEAQRAAE